MVKEINADSWEQEVIKSETPVVVDFWHEQCVWCLRLSPVYDELSEEYDRAVLAKINIQKNEENFRMAQRYGIMGTPTLKVFCEGREVGEVVGYMEKNALRDELESIMKNASSCLSKSTEL